MNQASELEFPELEVREDSGVVRLRVEDCCNLGAKIGGLLCAMVLVAAIPFGCRCEGEGPWLARVDSYTGDVTASVASGAPVSPAAKGQLLRLGARLETGTNAKALLSLRHEGRLNVEAESVVAFGGEAVSDNATRLVLEQGRLIGTTGRVEASQLVVRVGGRTIRLPRSARATIEALGQQRPKLSVSLGEARVETPGGLRRVLEGEVWVIGGRPSVTLDAGAAAGVGGDAATDSQAVVARPLTYVLRSVGRGRVRVKTPGSRRYRRVRRNRKIAVAPGTELKLGPRARVVFGPEGGHQAELSGPAHLVVREAATADGPGFRLESLGRDLVISDRGRRGKKGPRFVVEGVKVATAITYRRLQATVKRERGRAEVKVGAGEVLLTDRAGKKTRLEAGQGAVLTQGKVSGPKTPPQAALKVEQGGSLRVFASSRRVPITFGWDAGDNTLVEVSRSSSFARPFFSDVIKRDRLTLQLPRGRFHWRSRPWGESGKPTEGTRGRVHVLKDTSYRVLKNPKAPHNTIHESFGNTTVFYQNTLPRFTFRWKKIPKAARYEVKIFRENDLGKPLLASMTRREFKTLPKGRLGEGQYLWYVVARNAAGNLIRSTSSNRLRIRYDNATPDLQIVYPRNGVAVSAAAIDVRGITIPGSQVYINGQQAELDEAFRFKHTVALKPGTNDVLFRVVDKRRGSSLYLRRVVRR